MNQFYDQFDGPKWINFTGADYLTDNNDISVIFLVRLHHLRLAHRDFQKWFSKFFAQILMRTVLCFQTSKNLLTDPCRYLSTKPQPGWKVIEVKPSDNYALLMFILLFLHLLLNIYYICSLCYIMPILICTK